MNKRLFWVIAFVAPVFVIAFALWRHPNLVFRPPPFDVAPLRRDTVDNSLVKDEGVSRDITPQEYEDATNMLVQENRMWSRLSGMSADIQIAFEEKDQKPRSLEGTVQLRRLELSSTERNGGIIAKYGMILANQKQGWTVKADDTFYKMAKDGENTVISCPDPQISETIKAIGPQTVLHMLTFPQYFLASVYRDELYPQTRRRGLKPEQALTVWNPWVVTNAGPHSYTFWCAQAYQKVQQIMGNKAATDYRNVFPDFTFMDGHLHRVRRMTLVAGTELKEKMSVYFDRPVESNGFWYPTVLRITPAPTPWPYPQMSWGMFVPEGHLASSGQLCITVTNLSINLR